MSVLCFCSRKYFNIYIYCFIQIETYTVYVSHTEYTVLEEREMSEAFLNVCHLQFVRLSSFFQRFQDYSNKEDFHYFIHFTLAGFPSLFSLSVFSNGCSYFRRFVLLGEKTKPNFYSKYSRLQSFLPFPFSKWIFKLLESTN